MKASKLLILLAGLTIAATASAKKELNVPTVESVPGEFIVKLKDANSINTFGVMNVMATAGHRIVNKKQGLVLVKRNMLETQSFSLNSLASNDNVEYVEPNYIYRANDLPNDPKLSQLWGLINNGQEAPSPMGGVGSKRSGREGIDIGAQAAWQIQTGSRDVVVAVIDTGVDYTIADLAPNMWTNDAELNGKAGVDDDGNGHVDDIYGYDFANNDADPKDDHGHGSHCSGTIGARGNDGSGVVGVNWNVRIMALKFLTASGSGSLEGALKSIDYATENGAQIMSNSWGGGGHSQALKEAIERAEKAGALFIAAAGNHSGDNDARPTYPANYDVSNVMSVAAIDNRGELASFSCYGKTTVHVAAPGVDILSTTPGGFKSWSGTSMATPHVSGVAALVLANEPEISMANLKERLIATSRPIAGLRNKVYTGGIVNAYHALTNTAAPVDPFDPYYWPIIVESISTAHPYVDGKTTTWELTAEGASMMAVHFEKFDTERGYDKVTFKDKSGAILGVLSGNHDDSFSPVAEGDTLIIEFKADGSVNKHGFDIDGVAVNSENGEAIKVEVKKTVR